MDDDMELVQSQHPNWILDRRNSGFLYWRRETPEASKSVKFRCEVEVLEFWPTEEERMMKRGVKTRPAVFADDDMPPPSALVCAVCLCTMVAAISYSWFYPF